MIQLLVGMSVSIRGWNVRMLFYKISFELFVSFIEVFTNTFKYWIINLHWQQPIYIFLTRKIKLYLHIYELTPFLHTRAISISFFFGLSGMNTWNWLAGCENSFSLSFATDLILGVKSSSGSFSYFYGFVVLAFLFPLLVLLLPLLLSSSYKAMTKKFSLSNLFFVIELFHTCIDCNTISSPLISCPTGLHREWI